MNKKFINLNIGNNNFNSYLFKAVFFIYNFKTRQAEKILVYLVNLILKVTYIPILKY